MNESKLHECLLIEPPNDDNLRLLSSEHNIKNFDVEDYKNRHEYRGIKYLLSIGYDKNNIILNNYSYISRIHYRGTPDITTINDHQDWEIKYVVSRNTIEFTFDQICTMNPNTKIIIFRKNIDEPIDILEFKDIENKYRYKVYFKINIKIAKQLAQRMNKDIDNTLQRLILLDNFTFMKIKKD